jgi:O-antigen ligase
MKIPAFLLCVAFIAYLLRFDYKLTRNKVSFCLWLPTAWMLICASKPLGIWFGGADFYSGSSMDRIFLTLCFFIGFIILLKRNFDWTRLFRENRWLMLLLIYMLITLFWSDLPFVSFKRWFRELVAIIMALVVASDPAPREAMQSLFRRTAYILIPFSLFLIRHIPALGTEFHHWSGKRMWIGVALQKNGLGRLCVVCAFFLIWTLVRRWNGRDVAISKNHTYAEIFLLLLTFWILKGPGGAYPATAVVVLAFGLLLYAFLLWRRAQERVVRPFPIAASLTAMLAYGISIPYLTISVLSGFLEMLGRDATFTGRTAIWAALLPVASNQPFFGLGFGSFWTPLTRIHYIVGEAHNGYLDAALDIGYFGLLLLTLYLLSSCYRAVKGLLVDFDWACLWLCLLFMTVLHNATESSLNSLASHFSALLVFMALAFPAIAASKNTDEP